MKNLAFSCPRFETTLTVPQMKRAKTLTQRVSNWQTSVKMLLSSGRFRRAGGLLTLLWERLKYLQYRVFLTFVWEKNRATSESSF